MNPRTIPAGIRGGDRFLAAALPGRLLPRLSRGFGSGLFRGRHILLCAERFHDRVPFVSQMEG